MHGNRAATLRHAPRAIATALAVAAALAACAPTVETPADAAHRRDLRDAAAIAAQLARLPMVTHADVVLRRPVADPLRAAPPAAATAAVLLVHEARAAGGSLVADARALVAGAAPEVAPEHLTVVARPAAPPVVLAPVGPFRVAASSRPGLVATLVALLALCAGLGVTLAWRERQRASVK